MGEYRTAKRGSCRGLECQFIGAWLPLAWVATMDTIGASEHRNRSELLRLALQEKLNLPLPSQRGSRPG